ncbi:DUF3110 domain-containing protein [Pleurocapsales cyanobacterium LEGE 10410]|nr:DUF3110 domain-containing protein [Pleurocapsales cyanobacterium LEGE 10410]
MLVYILLFNAGTDNEGIHTVQMGDRNTILMFQEEDDALRYAGLLEAQDFPAPKVERIDSEEVEQFCRQADYDWKIVEPEQLEIPPERNVDELNWEQNLSQQEDSISQQEDSVSQQEDSVSQQEDSVEAESMPDDELERIRRKLEGLL